MIKGKTKKETKFIHALVSVLFLVGAMIYVVVLNGGSPQVSLIIGCAVSAVVAVFLGYSWDDILEYITDGISQSLEAILILLLIGSLVGSWIASGTVPAMVYYGLSLLNARYFLAASALICGIVSFAIGAWGTVGTVGIALMGIGTALNVPPALVAGSIISGSYFGDSMSPLSDATNLTAAVVGTDVFSVVKKRIIPVMSAFAAALVVYLIIGQKYAASSGSQVADAVEPLRQNLGSTFNISILAVIPMIVVVGCILLKIPAIPSMLIGVLSGVITAVFLQHAQLGDLVAVCTDGYVSDTGIELMDTLLTAGGMSSMMNTISIIIIAMAFGGIMQKTGQMRALVNPIVSLIKHFSGMNVLTVISCVLMNILLPDQYLGISVPGQMLEEEYDERGYSRVALASGLVGGAVSSPLIPWNTCGLYCLALLGISSMQYAKFAFFNLLTALFIIIYGLLCPKKASV